jgi:hypothetical protein
MTISKEECEHKWIEDKRFKNGTVMMFCGDIGKLKRETRVICSKCGCIDYLRVKKE